MFMVMSCYDSEQFIYLLAIINDKEVGCLGFIRCRYYACVCGELVYYDVSTYWCVWVLVCFITGFSGKNGSIVDLIPNRALIF